MCEPNNCTNCSHCLVVVRVRITGGNVASGLRGFRCTNQPVRKRWWHFGQALYATINDVREICAEHERIVTDIPGLLPLYVLSFCGEMGRPGHFGIQVSDFCTAREQVRAA
jgi:hypothetical protein